MVEKTSGSVMSIEEAIAYHLEYNFAVPFPATHIPLLIPACIQAIKEVNNHNLDAKIPLPKEIEMVDDEGNAFNYGFAYEIVARCRLDQWLNSEWF
jgi:hypothetical protein